MAKSKSQQQIVDKTAAFIRQKFDGEATGHDWYHIERVWKLAQKIAVAEGGDPFIVELGALLHDIADWKSHNDSAGGAAAREWLEQLKLDRATVNHVCDIVNNVSFKGLGQMNGITTLEGKVVQDADRLDAIGAIAIARAFAYGGAKGELIFNPGIELDAKVTEREYRVARDKKERSVIHHFYDKRLHLKDRLNTESARKMAKRRHEFMERYLQEFFHEWEVEA